MYGFKLMLGIHICNLTKNEYNIAVDSIVYDKHLTIKKMPKFRVILCNVAHQLY